MCNRVIPKYYLYFLIFVSVQTYADFQDPTQPASFNVDRPGAISVQKVDTKNPFVLDAILTSADSKIAIVNNQAVKTGDKVGDSTVKSIEAYQVILLGPKGERVLHLFGHPIKEPSK